MLSTNHKPPQSNHFSGGVCLQGTDGEIASLSTAGSPETAQNPKPIHDGSADGQCPFDLAVEGINDHTSGDSPTGPRTNPQSSSVVYHRIPTFESSAHNLPRNAMDMGEVEQEVPPSGRSAPLHNIDMPTRDAVHLDKSSPSPSPESTARRAETARPERSRNSKAQARHRAKRKAYIEQVRTLSVDAMIHFLTRPPQLEQTVTKLQMALGFTPEQVAALPSPLARIRELEQENTHLLRENDDLHRMLADSGGRSLPLEIHHRNSFMSFNDPHPSSHTGSSHSGPSSMFSLNMLSGSSSTSSPPLSPSCSQYVSIKAEDDCPVSLRHLCCVNYPLTRFQSSNHHRSSSAHSGNGHYTLPPFSQTMPDHAMDKWHGYSSERAPLHRAP
jgi:hypothetical protein